VAYSVGRPFSLFLDLAGTDWYQLRTLMIDAIVRSGASARVKVGIVIPPLPSGPVGITMSEYAENRGRSLLGTRRAWPPLYEESLLRQLHSELDIRFSREQSTWVRDIQLAECFSISDATEVLASELVELCADRGALVSAAFWSAGSPVSADLLWNGLILREIVSDGQIYTDYEDAPDDVDYSGDEVRWEPERSPERGVAGFFYNELSGPVLQTNLKSIVLPPDLLTSAMVPPPSTPLARVIRHAGQESVTRISAHDQRHLNAQFRLPYIHLQFPDVLKIEEKVRRYCFNRNHAAQKWVGLRNMVMVSGIAIRLSWHHNLQAPSWESSAPWKWLRRRKASCSSRWGLQFRVSSGTELH